MLITDFLKITHLEIHSRHSATGFILIAINDHDICAIQNLFLNPVQQNNGCRTSPPPNDAACLSEKGIDSIARCIAPLLKY